MKFIYPAVFSKTDDGSYQGYFPDLECCYAKGDTLEDAVDDANDCLLYTSKTGNFISFKSS